MTGLPLLDKAAEIISQEDLSDVFLIGGQHILRTTETMLVRLMKNGLDPNKTFIIGKCYSTSHLVLKQMKEKGFNISEHSSTYRYDTDFDEYYPKLVSQFLDDIFLTANIPPNSKIILLDDGGHLIEKAIDRKLHTTYQLAGVEQTSSGYERLKSLDLNFPIVNVARSTAKLDFESPIIARISHNLISKKLLNLNLWPEKVLILGNGAIGSAMHDELIRQYCVDRYDVDELLGDFASDQLEENLGKYDLIVGCTGRTSLPRHLHSSLKKGAVLASVSSSDREFDAVHLRKKANFVEDCHDDLHIGSTHLLNGGFPINFYGGEHSVPPEFIQLTRALLVLGIGQAASEMNNKSGFLKLKNQEQLITMHRNLHSKIKKPSFSTVG